MTPAGVPAEAGGPFASPGFWLHRSAQAYLRALDAALRPLGLTHTQVQVLAALTWLTRRGEAPSQQQVADVAGIDRMLTSRVLQVLEGRGLLQREGDPRDARAKRPVPTADGSALVSRATALARAVDEAVFPDAAGLRSALTEVVATAGDLAASRGAVGADEGRPHAPHAEEPGGRGPRS